MCVFVSFYVCVFWVDVCTSTSGVSLSWWIFGHVCLCVRDQTNPDRHGWSTVLRIRFEPREAGWARNEGRAGGERKRGESECWPSLSMFHFPTHVISHITCSNSSTSWMMKTPSFLRDHNRVIFPKLGKRKSSKCWRSVWKIEIWWIKHIFNVVTGWKYSFVSACVFHT